MRGQLHHYLCCFMARARVVQQPGPARQKHKLAAQRQPAVKRAGMDQGSEARGGWLGLSSLSSLEVSPFFLGGGSVL